MSDKPKNGSGTSKPAVRQDSVIGSDDGDFASLIASLDRDHVTRLPGATSEQIGRAGTVGLEYASQVTINRNNTDILKHIIGKGTTGLLSGASGNGKTFVGWDLAMAISSGETHYAGQRIKTCLVLYSSLEGNGGLPHRMWAAMQKYGDPGKRLARIVPRCDLGKGPNGELGIANLIANIDAIRADNGNTDERVLLFLDTMVRHSTGHDENSNSEMTEWLNSVDRLRDEKNLTVAIVAHIGKGKGGDTEKLPRGASAIRGNVDFNILVEKGLVHIQKAKDGPERPWFDFELKRVDLGLDNDGDRITTCTVNITEVHDEQGAAKATAKVFPKTRRAAAMLERLYADGLAERVTAADLDLKSTLPANVPKAVKIEAWRAKCAQSRLTNDGEKTAERKAFNRAKEDANAANLIGFHGEYVWLIPKAQTVKGKPQDGEIISTRMAQSGAKADFDAPAQSGAMLAQKPETAFEPGNPPPFDGGADWRKVAQSGAIGLDAGSGAIISPPNRGNELRQCVRPCAGAQSF